MEDEPEQEALPQLEQCFRSGGSAGFGIAER